jgi:hypothetical protein
VNKQLLIPVACIALLVGGASGTWLLRHRLTDAPKTHSVRDEYDEMVARLGGDEPAIRNELNDLASTSSATRVAADQTRSNALTRECLDPAKLLEIGYVREFVGIARRGQGNPFHFVSTAHRDRLSAIAGENPKPERVLAVRKALADLAAELELIRQPPDWSIKIEGEPTPMPYLDLLREGYEFLPVGKHPVLRGDPRIPAFVAGDGELLEQLDRFFNGERARTAFPPAKFPKLYVDGRIPPIPTAMASYREQIDEGEIREMRIILPAKDPEPDAVEAVNDVYAKLDRFLDAIGAFKIEGTETTK